MSKDNNILERLTCLEEKVEKLKKIIGKMEERAFGGQKPIQTGCGLVHRTLSLEKKLGITYLDKSSLVDRLWVISNKLYPDKNIYNI